MDYFGIRLQSESGANAAALPGCQTEIQRRPAKPINLFLPAGPGNGTAGKLPSSRSKARKVKGAVYEISEMDLRKLDRFEDYPGTYTHLNVLVFNEDDVALKPSPM